MRKLLIAGALVTGVMTQAQTAAADDWGCTVFLCVAAPFDPFSIPDCATALLRIRPWRLPTCSAANVEDFKTEEVELVCPAGWNRRTTTILETPEQRPDSRFEEFDEFFGRRTTVCADPSSDRTVPLGDYGEGYRITYRDENGQLQSYSFNSDHR